MGKAGGGAIAGPPAMKKKRGRPSRSDLHERALQQHKFQNQQRRSSRRNPISTSADSGSVGEDEHYDDDDDERKQKKVKLVVRLPQSDRVSSDLIRSSSVNSASGGSDSNAGVDNRKINARSDDLVAELVADHKGEKVLKAMDTLHGSPFESGPNTPLPDKKTLGFILDRLQKKDTHSAFSHPVDPDELPDYYEIIKQPMDFSTVRSKLDQGLYSNLEELEADVYLICSNAMQYNSSHTVFFRQARSIHELAKRDFDNLRQEGEDGELQPKVVKRGRPPGKQGKKPGRPPLDRSGPESTSGATLATAEDNTNESTPYNLRKTQPMMYRFQAYGSNRSRDGEPYSELSTDWNEEFPARIRKADMKYGNKNVIIDETRRDTYSQFHPSAYSYDSSIISNFDGERKQLLAVGLHAEHGYARSLARYAASLGPVVWKIASKKIEKALPPGTKYAPGLVGESDLSPPASSFHPAVTRAEPCLVADSIPNRPQTPSTLGPNTKVEIIKPDSVIRTGSPSHHVRNGIDSGFGGARAVEHESM